jgi:Spy/CpxP family protein refolding chaperone
MRRFHHLILMLCLILLMASPAGAQKPSDALQPPRGRGPIRGGASQFMFLRHPEIQKELQFTDAQKEKLKEIMHGLRDKMIDLVENNQRDKVFALVQEQTKNLDKLLTPEQLKRLKQVFLQVQGLWALTDPGIVKELKITDEQKEKLVKLQEESTKAMKKLFEGEASSRKEAQAKLAELHKEANAKGLRLLTAEQQTKWKEMAGPPFKGEIRRVLPTGR